MAPEIGPEPAVLDLDDAPDLARDLAFWMTRLPPKLRATPIIQLAIPGSHNTMTYTINPANEVGPDESRLIRTFGRYLSPVAKPIIFNWSVNQLESVQEQLDGGIRYLDLRVAGRDGESPERAYFLHGLYGAEVGGPLAEIAAWLEAHPRELVILDFQHFYAFAESHHRALIERIRATFRGKLCPLRSGLERLSLDQLAAERRQLIVVYRSPLARGHQELWPSGVLPTPWPDTTSTSRLVRFLDDGLRNRTRDVGFVSQCLLTPSTTYVARHICGNLRRDLSASCRGAALSWLRRCSPGSGGLNVVITDYVAFDDFLFSRVVIQRNATLLSY